MKITKIFNRARLSGGLQMCGPLEILPQTKITMSNNEKLQGTPDWSTAPEWANYWAVDANGKAYWFEFEPRISVYQWIENERGGDYYFTGLSANTTNWQTSLQKRP